MRFELNSPIKLTIIKCKLQKTHGKKTTHPHACASFFFSNYVLHTHKRPESRDILTVNEKGERTKNAIIAANNIQGVQFNNELAIPSKTGPRQRAQICMATVTVLLTCKSARCGQPRTMVLKKFGKGGVAAWTSALPNTRIVSSL